MINFISDFMFMVVKSLWCFSMWNTVFIYLLLVFFCMILLVIRRRTTWFFFPPSLHTWGDYLKVLYFIPFHSEDDSSNRWLFIMCLRRCFRRCSDILTILFHCSFKKNLFLGLPLCYTLYKYEETQAAKDCPSAYNVSGSSCFFFLSVLAVHSLHSFCDYHLFLYVRNKSGKKSLTLGLYNSLLLKT